MGNKHYGIIDHITSKLFLFGGDQIRNIATINICIKDQAI